MNFKKMVTQGLFTLIVPLVLSSCSMYKTNFDCPIPNGKPCMSVTQIERMIVERNEGPDLLVITDEHCPCDSSKQKDCDCQSTTTRRIWLCDRVGDNGVPIKGKSVYVEIEGKSK